VDVSDHNLGPKISRQKNLPPLQQEWKQTTPPTLVSPFPIIADSSWATCLHSKGSPFLWQEEGDRTALSKTRLEKAVLVNILARRGENAGWRRGRKALRKYFLSLLTLSEVAEGQYLQVLSLAACAGLQRVVKDS